MSRFGIKYGEFVGWLKTDNLFSGEAADRLQD